MVSWVYEGSKGGVMVVLMGGKMLEDEGDWLGFLVGLIAVNPFS